MRTRAVAILVVCVAAVLVLAFALRGPHPRGARSPKSPPVQNPVVAAADFLSGLTLARVTDDERRRRYLTRWSAPDARPALLRTYANEGSRVSAALAARPRVSRAAFIGYRLLRPRTDATVVTLWAVTIGGAGRSAVAVGLRTIRVELELVGRAWRISGIEEIPGPSPEMPVSRFKSAADQFRDFRVAP